MALTSQGAPLYEHDAERDRYGAVVKPKPPSARPES